ncbi:hypothetical protein FGG08_005981 [Glutinoglossum americanum]|uniref:STEEP1 domain-containing protein n=1 Tax=Glutinoglossum americanum TaxID=1670608 RepID=A0A9P8HXB7_9PEZI|nr:hypothetical protein FGG08_005981 [Glutinoglossum americanum]
MPKIHAYHCLCTHLLFASTHNISSLPRRRSPGLDNAIIVPLPPPPLRSSSPSSSSESEPEPEPPQASINNNPHSPWRPRRRRDPQSLNYTLLLSTTQDRKPHIISRADGFEKRYLWRCGRCRLIVGYQLDDVHFPTSAAAESAGDEEGRKGREKGRVLYLLPGGLMSTEEMAAGKTWSDKEIEVGGGGEGK